MIDVDICICTYRRASLNETLSSLARQEGDGLRVRVIVADNDEHPGRRREIEALARKLKLELRYLHAPAHNISVARNACLDAAEGDWVAFIDDDEVATPSWLATLLEARTGRDVVFGTSRAIYGPDASEWMRRGEFHSNRLIGRDREWNGYTANVLINRRFRDCRGLRFDPQLGRTGGEDSLFFYEAMRAGARFGYAPDAVVTEAVEASKASLKWLLLRRFRSGQTHHLILRREGRALGGTLSAAAKFGWSTGAAALSARSPTDSARHLLRSALHAGVVASALGLSTYREFGNVEPAGGTRPSVEHLR